LGGIIIMEKTETNELTEEQVEIAVEAAKKLSAPPEENIVLLEGIDCEPLEMHSNSETNEIPQEIIDNTRVVERQVEMPDFKSLKEFVLHCYNNEIKSSMDRIQQIDEEKKMHTQYKKDLRKAKQQVIKRSEESLVEYLKGEGLEQIIDHYSKVTGRTESGVEDGSNTVDGSDKESR
jgi:hypothetical protein